MVVRMLRPGRRAVGLRQVAGMPHGRVMGHDPRVGCSSIVRQDAHEQRETLGIVEKSSRSQLHRGRCPVRVSAARAAACCCCIAATRVSKTPSCIDGKAVWIVRY